MFSLILIAHIHFILKLYYILKFNIVDSHNYLANKFHKMKLFSVSLETADQWDIKALD